MHAKCNSFSFEIGQVLLKRSGCLSDVATFGAEPDTYPVVGVIQWVLQRMDFVNPTEFPMERRQETKKERFSCWCSFPSLQSLKPFQPDCESIDRWVEVINFSSAPLLRYPHSVCTQKWKCNKSHRPMLLHSSLPIILPCITSKIRELGAPFVSPASLQHLSHLQPFLFFIYILE